MEFKDLEFDWDEGNIPKIKTRFRLDDVEQFFQQDLILKPDTRHAYGELRIIAIGQAPTLKGDEKEVQKYEKIKEED